MREIYKYRYKYTSNFIMSLCRASISASVCRACCVSVIIYKWYMSYININKYMKHTPCVNTAALPDSNISSNWPSSTFLPAAKLQIKCAQFTFSSIYCLLQTSKKHTHPTSLTNFKLSLYTSLTSFTIISLYFIIISHNFDEFTRQRRMLCFTYAHIRRRSTRCLFRF